MTRSIFSILFLALFALSCNKEERLIDNSVNANGLYVANSETKDVSIYEYPAMDLITADILDMNGIENNSEISNIREFQDKVYILIPDEDKMIVIDSKLDTLIKINQFPNGTKPDDIYFSNIADGFVTFQNATNIANYDLVYNEIVRYIDGNSLVSTINSAGSFVYLTEPSNNSISVIDIRNYEESVEIELSLPPNIASITSKNELLIVSDRVSNNDNQFPAKLHYVDLNSNSIRETYEFGDSRINSNDIESYDILSTSLSFTFVATNKGLIRIDNRVDNRFVTLSDKVFDQIEYGPNFESIILLERNSNKSNIVISNSKSGAVVNEVSLPNNTNRFMIQQ